MSNEENKPTYRKRIDSLYYIYQLNQISVVYMSLKIEKPSKEAKALSLFLMAFKASSPIHKEKSKRINRLWSLVLSEDLDKNEYLKEVKSTLESFGGYEEVVEKTVQFYIDKTGEWKLDGEDQYGKDAQLIANKILAQ